MKADEQLEGVLYVDGHVNLYFGHNDGLEKTISDDIIPPYKKNVDKD